MAINIWVSGIERDIPFINGKQTIGIHRIYFSKDNYKGLSSTIAEKKYLEVKNTAIRYLNEMGVSEHIINKTFKIPSNEVYFLTESEVENIEGMVPYYDELLISRCGSYSKQEENDYITCRIYTDKGKVWNKMETSRKKGIANKCNLFSPSYLSHLEKTYNEIRKCRNMHNEIEQWKRMAEYLSYDHP